MKLIFAGLILFFATGAAAQTSNAINNNTQKKLTPGKMREVILADERQHEARAPITLSGSSYNSIYKLPSPAPYRVTRSNYVQQHHDALLMGLGTGLSIAKAFTRYGNMPNPNNTDLNNYYRTPQQTMKK